jgi:hypothetical protein
VIGAGRVGPDESGGLLFARYAYPPNALGYCGPDRPDTLLQAASHGEANREVRSLVPRFEGASVYLRLIAACNGIADPLDRRVVEAYWVGNSLLRGVPSGRLPQHATGAVGAAPGGEAVAPIAISRGVAHHTFHVFAVYPWLARLRSGKTEPALEVLDRCRIRWGAVQDIAGDMVTVRSRKLVFDGANLGLGPDRLERVRREPGGLGSGADLRPGDMITMHWDWMCDRLPRLSLHYLRSCTQRNLDAVNGAGARASPERPMSARPYDGAATSWTSSRSAAGRSS